MTLIQIVSKDLCVCMQCFCYQLLWYLVQYFLVAKKTIEHYLHIIDSGFVNEGQ